MTQWSDSSVIGEMKVLVPPSMIYHTVFQRELDDRMNPMNMHLTDKKCVACEGGIPPLTPTEISVFQPQVPLWKVLEDGLSISREFQFKDFKEALSFMNRVGILAEEEGHHPDMNLFAYRKVLITLSTHAIGGLSENDFILAAKIDLL